MSTTPWYTIHNIDVFDSPALVVFPDRIKANIKKMVSMVGSPDQLWPHVKTHKMAEVVQLQLDSRITKFKCATISEGEMLARVGAKEVLLAYQPVGPKIQRLIQLVQKFPNTRFYALVDHQEAATPIAQAFAEKNLELDVFLDLDVGMHRTGIAPSTEALDLFSYCQNLEGLHPIGLHIYDGHIRDSDLEVRQKACNTSFQAAQKLAEAINIKTGISPLLIAGGTPTFPVHAQRESVYCSPGTCLLWDWGYRHKLPELEFSHAALVISRIISKTGDKQICVDLGHKSIAAEQPFPRVHFLNLPNAQAIGQSEEHLVLQVDDNRKYPIGMVLYGIPQHICPTCALYEKAYVVEDHHIIGSWEVVSRVRKLTV